MSDTLCGHLRLRAALPPSVGSRLFGQVELAVDDQTGQEVWVTRIDPGLLITSYAMSDFMQGANGLRSLRHPDLVRLAVVDREETFAVVGYESLPGGIVLDDVIRRDGAMPMMKALDYGAKLLRGLAGLHRQSTIHGLLSPRTIVAWEGQALLWQYGLASHLPEPAIANRVRRHTDVELFAPEMRDGQLIPPTDLFAWAVCLTQMLTGLGPSEAVGEVLDGGAVDALPDEVRKLLRECLHTDPLQRPSDASHFEPRFEEATLTEASTMAILPMPMDGTPPPPPPRNYAEESQPESISMSDGDILSLEPDDSGSGPSASGSGRRPQDSGVDLARLAAGSVGEAAAQSLSNLMSPKVEGGPAAHESSPDLEALASALEEEEPGLRDLAPGGSELHLAEEDPHHAAAAGARDAEARAEARAEDGALPPPSVALPREERARLRDRPRGPGPYGPAARLMTSVFMVISGALVLLPLLHVANERGGFAALMPEPRADDALGGDVTVAASDTDGGTGSTGGGDAAAVEAETGEGLDDAAATPPVEAGPKPCPDGMVALDDAACIDVAEFPGLRRLPRVGVTMRDAGSICEQRDARLCSLAEWRRGCEGPRGAKFPYGGRVDPDACNTASIAGFPQEVRAAGMSPRCKSAVGAYDMVGNVGEWVAEGIAAGGDSTVDPKVATCSAKGRPPKGFSGESLGFRCCADR